MVEYILHGNNCVLKNYLIFVPTPGADIGYVKSVN